MNSDSTRHSSTNGKGKEQEIARLLTTGTPPSELVKQGYARGTVYKVAAKQSVPNQDVAVPEIEEDPEILHLKKDLRKAELERQLAAVKLELEGPSFEDRLANLEGIAYQLYEDAVDLEGVVRNTPAKDLRRRFECKGCGAKGLVAVRVVCTACDEESSYGWWPKKKR